MDTLRMDEIPHFIDNQIKPHLYAVLRVLGNERPESPVDFIAQCFLDGAVPERSGPKVWESSLMSYLLDHDVVSRVEQAISTCAVHHAVVGNPLEYVGNLLRGGSAADGLVVQRTFSTGASPPQRTPEGIPPDSPIPSPSFDSPPSPTTPRSSSDPSPKRPKPKTSSLAGKRSSSYDIISRGGHDRLYVVVLPAVLRAGPNMTSKRTERLRVGEKIHILESREDTTGVTRVRCSRGWLSLTSRDNQPMLVPVNEGDGANTLAHYNLRTPHELLSQCDPWSAPLELAQPGKLPVLQMHVSDRGDTFVETSRGWLCVDGWEKIKGLVPDWAPEEPLTLTLDGDDADGEIGNNQSGGNSKSSDGSTPGSVRRMKKPMRNPGTPGRNELISKIGQSQTIQELGLNKPGEGVLGPDKLFGANSSWRRNMSLYAEHVSSSPPSRSRAATGIGPLHTGGGKDGLSAAQVAGTLLYKDLKLQPIQQSPRAGAGRTALDEMLMAQVEVDAMSLDES